MLLTTGDFKIKYLRYSECEKGGTFQSKMTAALLIQSYDIISIKESTIWFP